MHLTSAVTFVSDLDRSVAFYCDLFGLTCAILDESAALLVGPENCELYLRGKHAQPSRVLGSVGIQYLMWSAESAEEFQRCEEALRRESIHVRRERLDDFEILEGRDPDNLPIMIAFPGPDESERHAIMPRIYSW